MSILNSLGSPADIIISVALMLFGGFLMTRLTKLVKLPTVTAYLVAGILMGPFCFQLIPERIISGMSFLSDVALAFIAFTAGEYLRISVLKKSGFRVIVITVFEAMLACMLVFILTKFVLRLTLPFSIVLSALAAATAPASTLMTIRQTGAKGEYVETLLQVVALDDVVGIIAYSIAISIATASLTGKLFSLGNVLKPIGLNLIVIVLGGVFGFLMKYLLSSKRTSDNRLIITVALVFAFCGVCALLGESPLLGCMSMGAVYINLTGDEKLFMQVNYFTPPILLLFFVRSGLNFDLSAILNPSDAVGEVPMLLVSALYFAVRIAGKYGGAWLGCKLAKKPANVRNWLGMALIPQASVAIGLAAIGARELGGTVGTALETIILASSIMNEFVGPACAKLSLYKSGSYGKTLEEKVPEAEIAAPEEKLNQVELLIRRIQKIQEEIPKLEVTPEEDAFTQAAEDNWGYYMHGGYRNKHHSNRSM